MLEGIHQKRTGEFRRVLRACAMAASRGKHALVLLVPRGQDPDGFLHSFHHHCRNRAGRPVRLLKLDGRTAPPAAIQGLRSVFGLERVDDSFNDARLTDLMGASDRLFERLADAIAAELATDDPGIGPGLMMIQGSIEEERTLLAFLDHLSPDAAMWRSITGRKTRPRQFMAVAAVPWVEAEGPPDLPENIETLAVRSLRARDLEAAPDAAARILLDGLDSGVSFPEGARRLEEVSGASTLDADARSDLVADIVGAGAFHDALDWIDGLDTMTRARCLVAAGHPDLAIDEGLTASEEDGLDSHHLLEVAELALARGDGHSASRLARAVESLGCLPAGDVPVLHRLRADLALNDSRLDEAMDHAMVAMDHAGDESERCACSNLLGRIAFRAGRHGEARGWFGKTAELAETGSVDCARAFHNLGLTALRMNHFGRAASLLQEAVVAADEAGEAYGGALARHNLAIALEFRGRYQASWEFAVDALERLARLGRNANVPGAMLTVADLLLTFGEVDRAMSIIDEARQWSVRCSLDRVTALCSQKEGEGRLANGDGEGAFEDLMEAWRHFDDNGMEDDAAFCAALLAEASISIGDLDRAGHWALTVTRMGRRPGDEANGRALLVDGLVARALEGPARALGLFEKARQVLKKSNQRLPLARLYLAMAEANEKLGDVDTAGLLGEEARGLLEEMAASIPDEFRKAFESRKEVAAVLGTDDTAEADADRVEDSPEIRPASVRSLPARPRLRENVPHIVGDSEALRRVLVTIERIRNVPVPVLLTGESGTGKELFAGAVHELSSRSSRPFVRVNAAAFTETLLLSELFGHEKGAFTGAHARKIGRFEAAHGGTLLLDEIGDVSERLQTALLRVIEDQSFERVGGTDTVHVDVRLIFSTNRDLPSLIKSGRFREDLYHRISGVAIPVPPLRERLEDVPGLVGAFLDEIEKETGRHMTLDDGAMRLLGSHSWPGNIRELKNVVRRTCLLTDGTVVTRDDIAREAPGISSTAKPLSTGNIDLIDMVFGHGASLFDARRELEAALVREALTRTSGNISAAAQLLGMKRPRLSQMVKEFGLKDLKAGRAGEVR